MCYKVLNVDFTKTDESGDPLVRLIFDVEFPSEVLAELIVEKLFDDAASGSDAAIDAVSLPVGLVNVHNGEITVYSDQPEPPGMSWDEEDVFRLSLSKADHVVLRAHAAGALLKQGVSPEALWASLGRFLVLNHPEVIGLDPDGPERREALAAQDAVASEFDRVADELAEKFGNPSDLSEEEMLKAIEYAVEQLQAAPDGVDPHDSSSTSSNDDTPPPAPKGLKVRGE